MKTEDPTIEPAPVTILTMNGSSTTKGTGAQELSQAASRRRRKQAMTAKNLARAKAVCGFNFEGSNIKWDDISDEMKMEACIQLALEFKRDGWAKGRLGSLYRSMLGIIIACNFKHQATVADDSADACTLKRDPGYASWSSFLTDARDRPAASYPLDLDGDTMFEMAMTPGNLERAKAVCEIAFSSNHPQSKTLTLGAKMEACIQMVLEFKKEIWATRKMGPIIISMLNRVVQDIDGRAPHSKAARPNARSKGPIANTQIPAMNEQNLPRAKAVHGADGSAPHSKAARASARSKGTIANKQVPAMNVQNLARAKAVCGLTFDGRRRTWAQLTLAEQTKALWELGLEFKEDVWARGRMGGTFREMITRILDDHNRNLDQIQQQNHSVDTRRNAINEKAHTVVPGQHWGLTDPHR
jgi:hypothetical protein